MGKVIIRIFAVFVVMTSSLGLFGCVCYNQNIDSADIESTFENDYEELQTVAEYLLSLDHHLVVIRNSSGTMNVDYGDKILLDDKEAKNAVVSLYNKGYLYISRGENTVRFERWKKALSHEFRAGFAYTTNSNGNINVQFLLKQQELSVNNWYYYEEDYNEWRSNNS